MKKIIILSLILSIFGTSCASRKVDLKKESAIVATDSASVTKKEIVTTQENNVNVVTDTDEIEISPVSDTIPMIVNGITYKNAKIRHKKTKVVLSDNTKTKVSEKAYIKASVKKRTKVEMVAKNIDKKSFHVWWIFFVLLIVAYYIYRKLKIK